MNALNAAVIMHPIGNFRTCKKEVMAGSGFSIGKTRILDVELRILLGWHRVVIMD